MNKKEKKMITTKDLIKSEFDKIVISLKKSYGNTQRFAINEAWKILQLLIASTVQILETIAYDLKGSEKKEIALELISNFYDTTFIIIDVPFIPNFIESLIHKRIKLILMMLVSSTIDSMVTIFRNTGVFLNRYK
jgi:hypothetical protein